MLTTFIITMLIFVASTATLIVCCKVAPIVEEQDPDEIDRIERIINSARHHREQLEARADELVRSHGYQWGSCDADDLASVIFDGADYGEALERIMRRKLNKSVS